MSRIHRRVRLCAAAVLALAATWPVSARAQTHSTGSGHAYPAKPVRVINPFAPGGPVDIVGRTVAQELSKEWGQPVIVDNRPGAGTTLGAGLVARATPDGYTLLVTSVSTVVAASVYPNPGFDPIKDLAPVAVVAQTPLMFGVHPSMAAKSVQEFISLARAKPGQIRYGSAGQGTITHLSGELFKSLAKIDLVHVPYKGGAPSVTATTAGEVQAVFDQTAALLPHVKGGKLRALGMTSAKRVDFAPDLPTFIESGVPGFEVTVWNAILAPGGTPRAIVDTLNTSINRALKQAEVRDRLIGLGLTPVGGSAAEFGAMFRSEVTRWKRVSKEAGVKIE